MRGAFYKRISLITVDDRTLHFKFKHLNKNLNQVFITSIVISTCSSDSL